MSREGLGTNAFRWAREDFKGKLLNNEFPNKPTFDGSPITFHQESSKISTIRIHVTPCLESSNGSAAKNEVKELKSTRASTAVHDYTVNENAKQPVSSEAGVDINASQRSSPVRLPAFYASQHGAWHALICYESCVRMCLHSWAQDRCSEAPYFLNDECALLQEAFRLQQVLLQPEDELLAKQPSKMVSMETAQNFRKTYSKIKVQVRKVNMGPHPPTGCSLSSLKLPKLGSLNASDLKLTLHTGWQDIQKVHVTPNISSNSSFFHRSLAYFQASTHYIEEVSSHLKAMVTTLYKQTSGGAAQEKTFSCILRLKSSSNNEAIRTQPGSGETLIFFPDSRCDDLTVEVQDSKQQCLGCTLVQVAALAEDLSSRQQWWPIYHEPDHELVGRLQLHIDYSTCQDEIHYPNGGSVAETLAYDQVLEVAMKVEKFHQRKLQLHGPWKWLVTKYASYYGIPDAYTKLRYLSYIMDVATPTEDCLSLVCNLLSPVVGEGKQKKTLSHQEKRMLGVIDNQVQQMLSLVFENYKSLDESSPLGMKDVLDPATGIPAPALTPAVNLYTLLHDISSSEAQLKLCKYFQSAAKKRSRRHLAETHELICNDGMPVDQMTLLTYYQKMTSLVLNIRNEIVADIEIQKHHVLPSFIDLPNLSSSIYGMELSNRLTEFLTACPPPAPSPPIVELLLATADFQKDLACWNICPVKGGVDAKELFHSYINSWIQDKRLDLLESCKLEKVKWSGTRTQESTTPFVEHMYDRLKETMKEYETIIFRWPEYLHLLENAIADVERAILEALEKQNADVLAPLKDILTPKMFGLKYVQKISKRSVNMYFVQDELGVFLNSIKKILDVLHPEIENHLMSWSSSFHNDGKLARGEHLTEVSILLRAKFRSFLQAIEEKLAENTRVQSVTRLKKIIQEVDETVVESEIRSRMQPLKDMVIETIDHLHGVVHPHLFIAICRGFWDRLGQDLLHVLESQADKKPWYKGLRIAVSILDEIFTSEMQQLLGNTLQEKDLEPPRFVMEVDCMLSKDAASYKDKYFN
ncbi:hypothetical protein L6164_020524 [Bauhinia variegata]|uniref:Uncharacterized protein n=1 Tax=Bauhinia variegata TaxID=167791 RepID=A0ACB9MWY7_BAUVA|nr:hypothetical protein L6164_020524 [Bauhinia variegata]